MAIDRRGFVKGAGLVAAGAALPARALAATTAADPIRGWIIVNALGGLGDPNHPSADSRSSLSPRVLAEAHASGLTTVNVTLGYVAGPGDPFELTVRDIAATDRMIRDHAADVTKILTAADIRRARTDGKIGLLYGFQNGAMMGNDVSRVDVFADLGVRVFQLTYNPANQIGDGSMAPENRGITPFGREVIARLNERRVMVDLSHSGQRTCLEAARIS
ncbi:MAG: membrane dipeptidase, partial [Sphingomonas bacterium]